ncbi:hypothetical protein GCM10010924_43690 [Rhizobium wenxiniae]|uniref:Cysteine rich repeat protein n=1 Tax=Rhizobium wenxiniae TaxID=1737357 RepID=A0A7X0D1Z4_9HYPH|nr:cysteine rich repeat-containing protein [Rhizobium wenxiniae]MBB6165055.1 hypothetical protein [Rhizobium wenxiniae]GGG10002.1 hypothetical protein GCM10010924_43690 [Rhizobium wenxiniae]
MLKYATILLLMTAATASAQQLSMSDKLALRDNCKQDIQKLCADIKPGGGQLMACVQEKKAQLSQECAATLADLRAKAARN